MKMNLQRQKRRSSEVRGCLLKNFLEMRKRSLIRSESKDSGFSLESYEPFITSSFDAEKFLEELGFAGERGPLIPDRFIPSLIHRISDMPDETVVKLDSRVWNSIDSFKKKESTLWFFTQSSVECDLCLNDLQRSFSVPAEYDVQRSYSELCNSSYSDDSIHAMENSSPTSRIENWLSRFPRDSLTVADKTKANIAHISNQSSTESGVLSALSDDEAYTTTNHVESFSVRDSCRSRDKFGLSVPPVQSASPIDGMDIEEHRTLKVVPGSKPSGRIRYTETINVNAALHFETFPNLNDKAQPSRTWMIPSISKRERYLFDSSSEENSGSFEEQCSHCKSVGENVTEMKNPYEISQVLVTSDGKSSESDIPTCGQCSENNGHYVDGETEEDDVKDADSSSRRVSLSRNSDVKFDRTKKRHSFDSAYLTAAEKRKRFRQSHSKTHNFLFKNVDSCLSANRLKEIPTGDEISLDSSISCNLQVETEYSDEHRSQEKDDDPQIIPLYKENNRGTTLEITETIRNIDMPHNNRDSLGSHLEATDSLSNVCTSHYNGDHPDNGDHLDDTTLELPEIVRSVDSFLQIFDTPEVPDSVSNIDISHHNGERLDTPLVMTNTVGNVGSSYYNEGNLDTPLDVSGNLGSVSMVISHHNGNYLDNPLKVPDSLKNVDMSHDNGENLDTPLKLPEIVRNADISHYNGESLDSPLEMSESVGDADSPHRDGDYAETSLKVSDKLSNVSIVITHHNRNDLATSLEVPNVPNNVDISLHNPDDFDTSLEVLDTASNVNTSHHNVEDSDTSLEMPDTVSYVDILHDNRDTSLEVHDTVSNVDISHHNGDHLHAPLEVPDTVSSVDISHLNAGDLDTSSGVLLTLSDVEQFKLCEVPWRSDSESSEQYFSCEELLATKVPSNEDFTDYGGDKEKKEILVKSANIFPPPTVEQRTAPVKMTPQVILRDKALFRNCNRSSKYKEHFILNKILKRSLKLSVLCPDEKMSRNFLLENDRADSESFSQILNSSDPPNSAKSVVLEKYPQVVTCSEGASHGALLNSGMREKSVERILCDKESELDNSESNISKPFVRNLLLTTGMVGPKCEARLINYDGLALFWAARHTAESSISCNSGFKGSSHSKTGYTTNKRFINSIHMAVNDGNGPDKANNKVYRSEVRLEINSDEAEGSQENKRLESSEKVEKIKSEKDAKVQGEDFKVSKRSTNTENPCGRALKDLEDLKCAIQKAKETRMSASRELKLLQELLHTGDNEDDETIAKRATVAVSESKMSLPAVDVVNGNHGTGETIEALSELQQKSAKEASQNKEFWEEEIRKTKEEISQACHEKLSIMEGKLHTTEDELDRALKENTRLKDQLELRSTAFPACKCNAEAQQHSDYSHMNEISDEDHKNTTVVKPSVSTKNFWQEWDRLQSDLMKAERKADDLNILLNQKLIELNRMQLALSKQTKEMILLEKAYFQLRSHLSKRKLNKSGMSPQSASTVKTASETSSKATDPEIPP